MGSKSYFAVLAFAALVAATSARAESIRPALIVPVRTSVGLAASWDGINNGMVAALNTVYGATYGNITTFDGNPTVPLTLTSQTLGTAGVGGLSLQYVRVLDGGGGDPLDIHTLGTDMNDQTFKDGSSLTTFQVKLAANTETFGWYDRTNGNAEHQLLTTAGTSTSVTLSSDFGFYITSTGIGGSQKWYSDQSRNIDGGADHMVMYRLDAYQNGIYIAGQPRQWLLAFEDLNLSQPGVTSDADYQDVVVSLTTTAVPLPAAVWSGLAMLGGLGAFGMMRRKVRLD